MPGTPPQRAHAVPRMQPAALGHVPVVGRPVRGHPELELNWARTKLGLSVTSQHFGQSPGSGEGIPLALHTPVPEPQGPKGNDGGFACPAAPCPTASPQQPLPSPTTKAALMHRHWCSLAPGKGGGSRQQLVAAQDHPSAWAVLQEMLSGCPPCVRAG